ncbi:peroxiredoxin-like family protein [Maribacter sp. SA7]|uniref:peroxiredoxin-like family protein n=1 Tax=Maribacter zhoushanensis TaxID=3030012 RepID=UPI0023EBECDA|nr:peroxiredoxin-like family protein [Maribacter zhoushanensis]MDF4203829.1 peroxiredoxin-like family protein [Maribacter zhoushanensis]
MKLNKEEQAPNFRVKDIFGTEIDLSKMDSHKILISFFRYAECALCNLRIAELKRASEVFQKEDIEVITIFQSHEESLKESIHKRHELDFTVISDPNFKLYDMYGVTTSWGKLLRTASLKGIKSTFAASSQGFKLGGRVEGKFNQIPADFLLDRNKRIKIAHYGSSLIDHMPLEEILN